MQFILFVITQIDLTESSIQSTKVRNSNNWKEILASNQTSDRKLAS